MRRISDASTEGLLCVGRGILSKTTARIVHIGGKKTANERQQTLAQQVFYISDTLASEATAVNLDATRARDEKKLLLPFGIWLSESTSPLWCHGGNQRAGSEAGRCHPRLGARPALFPNAREDHLFPCRMLRFWLGATNTWLIVHRLSADLRAIKTFTRQMCNRGTAGGKCENLRGGVRGICDGNQLTGTFDRVVRKLSTPRPKSWKRLIGRYRINVCVIFINERRVPRDLAAAAGSRRFYLRKQTWKGPRSMESLGLQLTVIFVVN